MSAGIKYDEDCIARLNTHLPGKIICHGGLKITDLQRSQDIYRANIKSLLLVGKA